MKKIHIDKALRKKMRSQQYPILRNLVILAFIQRIELIYNMRMP